MKTKPCTMTIFYSVGREARVFRSVVLGCKTPEQALAKLEKAQGPVNHALVYAGKLPDPILATF
jgi:hypothetical protein